MTPSTSHPGLLQAALDALPVAAIVSDAGPVSTRILAINRRFEDLLGWTNDELVGQEALVIYGGPIGVGDLESSLDAVGELLHYETQARRKDGGFCRIKSSTSIFELDGRRFAVSTSVAVDSDELSDALHESEARLQAILDAVPFLFAMVEPDGRFRLVNRVLSHELDRPPEQILGRRLEEVFTAGSAAAMRAYLARMADGADLEIGESVFESQHDRRRFRTSCFPLRHRRGSHAGTAYAACLLAVDVTDERATEAALRESDTHFRQLAASIDDAFVLWGGDPPQVLYASPALPKLYGLDSFSEIPADDGIHDRRTHPDDEALRWRMYHQRINSDDDLDYEYRIIHPNGDVRWIRVRSSRVRIDGRPVDRIATTMADITEHKQAELDLRAAWAAADEANRRKNDFLSRMSHELRTPLNAILGFTQLLELDDLTLDQRASLAHVGQAGRHLLELINDVLDVSRIESGELRLSLGPVDLAGAVLEAVAMMHPLMDESDVTLDVPRDAASVTVTADRPRLIQILLNLLSNAVKFNRPGGRAWVRWTERPDGHVVVDVRDTGIGLAPADVDRLFTPFERFAPEIDGTGIGLVLTRQLVEAMHGTLAVESTLGEGTTVTIDLPSTGLVPATPVAAADDAGPDASARRRVLCALNDPADAELVRRAVELVPTRDATIATSGRDAIARAVAARPGLVLLDLDLADPPGADVLRALRAQPETAGVDVVVIAGELSAGGRRTLRELGVDRVLVRPYKLSQLIALIEDDLVP